MWLVRKCRTSAYSQSFLVFCCTRWDLWNAGIFFRTYFTHETMYAYVSLFKGCWNIKKSWMQTYFALVTVDSVENFRHFSFWRHGTRLATFFIAPKNWFFQSHWDNKNSGIFGSRKVARFWWNPPIPLLHPSVSCRFAIGRIRNNLTDKHFYRVWFF